MRPIVVVELLPFPELLVEDLCIVDDDPVEKAVELFGVDPVRALDLPIQARARLTRLDVDVADASIEQVPVETRLEL